MRKFLAIVAVMIGLSSATLPAWATCKFNVITNSAPNSIPDLVIKTAVKAWQGVGADINISVGGGSDKGIDFYKVDGCSQSTFYYLSSLSNGTTRINMCNTQVVNGKYQYINWGFSAYEDSYVVSLSGAFYEALGRALGVPYSGNTNDIMYKGKFNSVFPLSAGDKAALKAKYPPGSCPTNPKPIASNQSNDSSDKKPSCEKKYDFSKFGDWNLGDCDQDGTKNQCDQDADGDGILNGADNCPLNNISTSQQDIDGDGWGDWCDPDVDGDGIMQEHTLVYCYNTITGKKNEMSNPIIVAKGDNCPFHKNKDQSDFDKDGKGDVCDPDDDNDGLSDELEDQTKNLELCWQMNSKAADTDGDGLSDYEEYDYNVKHSGKPYVDHYLKGMYGPKFASGSVNLSCPNFQDTDADGLSDKIEIIESLTLPNKADTDGDTLSDGDEWKHPKYHAYHPKTKLRLDPTKKDSDGDGLKDNEELEAKTDPRTGHSDDDLLTDFYEVKYAKALKSNPTEGDTDKDKLSDDQEYSLNLQIPKYEDCVLKNVDLKTCMPAGELEKVFYLSESDRDGDGLDDKEESEEGTYPGSSDTDKDTLSDYDEIYGSVFNKLVKDAHTKSEYTQKDSDNKTPTLASNPTEPDTDKDGLADQEELKFRNEAEDYWYNYWLAHPIKKGEFTYTKEPIKPTYLALTQETWKEGGMPDPQVKDSDGDGIEDGDEILLGGLPYKVDTDDDGLSDWTELYDTKTKLDNPDTDNDGLTDYEEVEGIFKFTKGGKDYERKVKQSNPKSVDTDNDGVCDGAKTNSACQAGPDNCVADINKDQTDKDQDGIGDVCDVAVDSDQCGQCAEMADCVSVLTALKGMQRCDQKEKAGSLQSSYDSCFAKYTECVQSCSDEENHLSVKEVEKIENAPSASLSLRRKYYFLDTQLVIFQSFKALKANAQIYTGIVSEDPYNDALNKTRAALEGGKRCDELKNLYDIVKPKKWLLAGLTFNGLMKVVPTQIKFVGKVGIKTLTTMKDVLKVLITKGTSVAEKKIARKLLTSALMTEYKGLLVVVGASTATDSILKSIVFNALHNDGFEICVDDDELLDLATDEEALVLGTSVASSFFIDRVIENLGGDSIHSTEGEGFFLVKGDSSVKNWIPQVNTEEMQRFMAMLGNPILEKYMKQLKKDKADACIAQ